MEDKKVAHLLWTGGLDSTYRMVELSRQDCVVQSHYVSIDRKKAPNVNWRKSRDQEIKAIHAITELLQRNPNTKATILSPIIAEAKDVPEYEDILDAFFFLHDEIHLNTTQYALLACYARQHNLKMEMGIRFSQHGLGRVIAPSSLTTYSGYDDVVTMMDTAPQQGKFEQAVYTLFHDFLFPKSLAQKQKRDEAEALKQWGYEDVLKKVWFCFTPVFGMPCGHCGPCRSAKREGIGYMIPFIGNFCGAIRNKLDGGKRR